MARHQNSSVHDSGHRVPVDAEGFRLLMSRFASGVTVVTAADDGMLEGATVSSFCSVSLDPPLVLVCLARSSATHHAIEHSGTFAVNILRTGDRELALHFAGTGEEKFETIPFVPGCTGSPLLREALAVAECEVSSRIRAGDHTIIVGRVIAAEARGEDDPMIYFRRDFHRLAPSG